MKNSNQILTRETMSSIEIAELTGKRHADVMRDIRNLLDQGVHQRNFALTFRVNDLANGAQRKDPYYELTKKGCLILASGYNALLREKIIDRWEQLETKERNGSYVQLSPLPLNTKRVRVKNVLKSCFHKGMMKSFTIFVTVKTFRGMIAASLYGEALFMPKHFGYKVINYIRITAPCRWTGNCRRGLRKALTTRSAVFFV